MRYRITLDNTIHDYEAVIFRDFKEQEGGKGQNITMKKLANISAVSNALEEEMRGQSAFTVKRVEEVPSD
ncbi:MAG TPA: hypothetical protein VGR53_00480 [Nitrososphaerales archaeon]|nr:hypothetical protein [Nitrososphaerales archaeon]